MFEHEGVLIIYRNFIIIVHFMLKKTRSISMMLSLLDVTVLAKQYHGTNTFSVRVLIEEVIIIQLNLP